MIGENWNDVIFYKGLDNPGLADGLMAKMKEYVGKEPNIANIDYRKFVDRELDDAFAYRERIKGKVVVFFECLKDETTMLRFLQLCWAAKKQYGAKRIVAMISFLHYRRQDPTDDKGEIKRNLWLMEMMKHNGIDDVIVVTPHSEATKKNCLANDLGFREVDPSEAFASVVRPLLPERDVVKKAAIYSPDEGSIQRAIALAKFLKIKIFFNIKGRGFDNETAMIDADEEMIEAIIAKYADQYDFHDLEYATPENIKGMYIIMVEDEVDTGGTANRQGIMLKEYGAIVVIFLATHPVCSDGWKRKLPSNNPFDKIIMCNTIPRDTDQRTGGLVHDVSLAGLCASEVYRALVEILQ